MYMEHEAAVLDKWARYQETETNRIEQFKNAADGSVLVLPLNPLQKMRHHLRSFASDCMTHYENLIVDGRLVVPFESLSEECKFALALNAFFEIPEEDYKGQTDQIRGMVGLYPPMDYVLLVFVRMLVEDVKIHYKKTIS